MDTFFRNNNENGIDNDKDIEMQIIEWWAQDEFNEEEESENEDCKYCGNSTEYCKCNTDVYTIRCFGVTSKGKSITCKITGFNPYFYIKVDSSFNRLKLSKLLEYIESSYINRYYPKALAKENNRHLSSIVEKKDLFGFRNGKYYKFVRLVFTNHTALMKVRYLFKKPVNIHGLTNKPTKFKLYESNIEGFMRYCHVKDIFMAGWIKLPARRYKLTYDTTTTQQEVSIDRNDVVSLKEKQEMATFLQASWDIEVYSHDYTFPEPEKKQNEIFQIATTYKYYGDSKCCVKHLLTLKKCAPITDKETPVIVEECKNEKELIKKWVDTISAMDPDIFFTYNGDSFDCRYIIKRACLLGLASENSKTKVVSGYFVNKLSRMCNKQAEMRKEFFSSSAYGDSEFYRLYVPGRLNYDLLIHYKRGMKKYSSYKLDYIANEILKEGKHDVTARDIFTYYEQGTPEKIRTIGEYCFVEGTRVSLPSCSVDIKALEQLQTDVVTWIDGKGFNVSKKVHFFNNGTRECISLTFTDGTQLKCTPDHQILTKKGWIEAQHLTSNDKVLFYPEPAYVDYNKEKSYTFKFCDNIEDMPYEQACIFARVLGYLLTDGCIYEHVCYKNYSTRIKYVYDSAQVYIGTKIDALNMQQDILTLTGKLVKLRKEQNVYTLNLPSSLTKMYLSLDGVGKGNRMLYHESIPTFLKNGPEWIVREFVKGLMGGDGSCPSFSDDKFGSVIFCQSKDTGNLDNLTRMMEDVQSMFSRLQIKTIITKPKKNKKGNGFTQTVRIVQEDLVKFYETIGYAYCVGKSYKLSVVASYYKLRNETRRQLNWVRQRVEELREHMSTTKAIQQAHQELRAKEHIFNEHYSLPSIGTLGRQSHLSKFKKEYFPSAKDYLLLTESYDKFVSNDQKKSYAVDQDAEHSPCYHLSVVHKENIGEQMVYDIEVKDTHNFVANGAVVHNCVQDTELLQKLVDKQLILTNIIQLANVTYVPIGFLTTRGQTIKVFSQLLRKARQMDFLVPHTNFNEDSYPITLKFKEVVEICDDSNIGQYLDINLGSQGDTKRTKITARISEIVDENTLIALSDVELTNEMYNRKISFGRREYTCFRISSNEDAVDDSFTGATVLEPKPGWYGKDNIAVLDFASLYPTVEISRNLCYSTLVMNDKYLGLQNVKYETVKWNDTVEYKLKQTCQGVGKSGKSKGQVCGKQAFFEIDNKYFCRIHDPLKKGRTADEKHQKKDVSYNYTIVQPHTDSDGKIINKGVIPALLEELYSERKRVKKQMAKAQNDGNKLLADILDSTQLAIKVSLNSVYGFVSRGQGNLICKALGQLTTAVGRMLIEESKEYAEGLFVDYVIKNNLATHKVQTISVNMTKKEKDNILQRHAAA
jgi:DNA polymerase elongation subunit (family B)